MSISIKKYVDITSGVGGSAAVKERELILRLFTKDTKVPAGVVMEFTDINDVATTFGTASEEYKRAALYFGFVSKIITKAKNRLRALQRCFFCSGSGDCRRYPDDHYRDMAGHY